MIEAARAILDASALLAFLRKEPGAPIVRQALAVGAVISSVNWAEVLSKLTDLTGQDADVILTGIRGLGLPGGLLTVLPLTEADAVAIGRLRPVTRPFGLSLADRAALAVALRLGATVLTADRAWQQIDTGVSIQLIR